MFVIVHNNNVVLGPMPWRKLFFENMLEDDLEVTVTLPQKNEPESLYVVNDEIKIYPCRMLESPAHNPKIHWLNGPYWVYTDTEAIGSMTVHDYPIDTARGFLKEPLSATRYAKEIAGTKITLQNTEVTLDTMRGSRDIFLQSFQLGADNITWKFPEGWLTLSNAELGQCVQTIMGHVQTCFAWEAAKVAELDACETLDELDLVNLKE